MTTEIVRILYVLVCIRVIYRQFPAIYHTHIKFEKPNTIVEILQKLNQGIENVAENKRSVPVQHRIIHVITYNTPENSRAKRNRAMESHSTFRFQR
eukprot:UN06043